MREELELFSECLVIGGDLNLYLDPKLDKDNAQTQKCLASSELKNVLEEFNYVDIWRILNPGLKRYTWGRRRPLIQSRLDYWLIPSEMIYLVDSCSIKLSIKTDNNLISFKLSVT